MLVISHTTLGPVLAGHHCCDILMRLTRLIPDVVPYFHLLYFLHCAIECDVLLLSEVTWQARVLHAVCVCQGCSTACMSTQSRLKSRPPLTGWIPPANDRQCLSAMVHW